MSCLYPILPRLNRSQARSYKAKNKATAAAKVPAPVSKKGDLFDDSE